MTNGGLSLSRPTATELSPLLVVKYGMSKFTIEFGPIATAKLDELATEAERSKTEIVRRALDVYNDLFDQTHCDGKRLILEDPKTGEQQNLLL